MDRISFQSYLDCVYGGVERRYFSNVVEIEVERQPKPAIVRKSIKIPQAKVCAGDVCSCRTRNVTNEMLAFAIMILCKKNIS